MINIKLHLHKHALECIDDCCIWCSSYMQVVLLFRDVISFIFHAMRIHLTAMSGEVWGREGVELMLCTETRVVQDALWKVI